jgi:hypothetical protein
LLNLNGKVIPKKSKEKGSKVVAGGEYNSLKMTIKKKSLSLERTSPILTTPAPVHKDTSFNETTSREAAFKTEGQPRK